MKDISLKRKNAGDKNDIIDRIDKYLQNDQAINIRWHKACHNSFTHKSTIQRLEAKFEKEKITARKINNETCELLCLTHSHWMLIDKNETRFLLSICII